MSGDGGELYRVVFRGEISLEFSAEEVRTNLKQLCRYEDRTLDRLFSGKPVVIKDRIQLTTARQYKEALDRTGALCEIVAVPKPPPSVEVAPAPQGTTCSEAPTPITMAVSPPPQPLPSPSPEPVPVHCPKCGHRQPDGEICGACGIVFARFLKSQERQAAIARGETPPDMPRKPEPTTLMEDVRNYFSQHQEQAFILKAFLTIAVILLIGEYLSGFVILFIILFPVLFLFYVRLEAASTGQSATEILAQHITFMPVMYTDEERKREGTTWVTYGLIFINIVIFYGYELHVDPKTIMNHLVFIPVEPNILNVPFSLLSSMFLHAGGGHLWGNMLFLWAVGTVVEKRIGWGKFLACYLAAGVMASLLSALITYLFFHEAVHGLGASGAIAGVMGIFAVRCYFKSMVFPLPILGIFSLILPISLKVRLNSLVIIGLFFFADLSGGIGQITGENQSNVGHWAHIGGMLCGIILAMLSKLGEDAIEERHVEIGRQNIGKRGDLYAAEDSLRLALKKNPDNADTMLLLAQLLSKFQATEEGEQLYRKSLASLSATRPREAMEAYRDFFKRYHKGLDYQSMLRLAGHYQKQNDLEWAGRCLEFVLEDTETPQATREKVMLNCARSKESSGNIDAAEYYYRMFLETFPQSPMAGKVRIRLGTT